MKENKSIGGYFELETGYVDKSYHPEAIALNTARNALEYILKAKKAQKLYLPYFTCDVLLEPLQKLEIPFEFYSINTKLEPIFDFSTLNNENSFFLYTNYFGLKDKYVEQLSLQCSQLIVDNAQAFYSKSYSKFSIYSSRKFFGVADGAYMYCDSKLKQDLEKDISCNRMQHLLIRKDISAESGYNNFVANDKVLEMQPIKRMSTLSSAIMASIDFETIAKRRIENYNLLDTILKKTNQLCLRLESGSVPMVYPYWTKDINLRQRLLKSKIYTAVYWPSVKEWCKNESLEYRLVDEVVYLPIDQRYGIEEMNEILKIIIK